LAQEIEKQNPQSSENVKCAYNEAKNKQKMKMILHSQRDQKKNTERKGRGIWPSKMQGFRDGGSSVGIGGGKRKKEEFGFKG
jgi:uncharacterized membrane protein YgcG